MNDRQGGALVELRSLGKDAGNGLRVGASVTDDPLEMLRVHVEIDVSYLVQVARAHGLPMRDWEAFELFVPPEYPFVPPAVWKADMEWADRPHVNWGRNICLYLAPSTQWGPAQGMRGLLDRLDGWLEAAAAGRLDPQGVPVHPPATYQTDPGAPHVIVAADTATLLRDGHAGWTGFAAVEPQGRAFRVVSWLPPNRVERAVPIPAVAFFADQAIGSEWPVGVGAVLALIDRLGLSGLEAIRSLSKAARSLPPNAPLLFLLGTRQGGRPGDQRHVHVVGWEIPPEEAARLARLAGDEEAEGGLQEWYRTARARWCWIDDARPSTTARRDDRRPVTALAGLSVALWGCGALGGALAEILVRAGVRRLALLDSGSVGQGILVRQPYEHEDVGWPKVEALRARLLRIAPDADVMRAFRSAIRFLEEDGLPEADLLIDTTANTGTSAAIEYHRTRSPRRPAIASLGFDVTARRCMLLYAPADADGGPHHYDRLARRWVHEEGLIRYRNALWPPRPPSLVDVDLGCSSPTFRASFADVLALAAPAADLLGARTMEGRAAVDLFASPILATCGDDTTHASRTWAAWRVLRLPGRGEARVDPDAMDELQALCRGSLPPVGNGHETGGLVFGEYDPATGVLRIDRFGPPTADSEGTKEGFVLSPGGLQEQDAAETRTSGGTSRYVGAWHTHPAGGTGPSPTDLATTRAAITERRGERVIGCVVTGSADDPVLSLWTEEGAA